MAGAIARIRGSVKWFNVAKGFGFITRADTKEEVFVHQSNIVANGFRSLADGEEVEFDIENGEKGITATRVSGPNGSPVIGQPQRLGGDESFSRGRGGFSRGGGRGGYSNRGDRGSSRGEEW